MSRLQLTARGEDKGMLWRMNLEGDSVVVVASINLFGDTTVCAICSYHHVNLNSVRLAHFAILVVVEVQRKRSLIAILSQNQNPGIMYLFKGICIQVHIC